MKTIEEWFQGLTEDQQQYLINTVTGFNVDVPSYFKFDQGFDLDKIHRTISRDRFNMSNTSAETKEAHLFLLYNLNKHDKTQLPDKVFFDYLLNAYYDFSTARELLPKDIYLKYLNLNYNKSTVEERTLDQLLITTEDFDNIDWLKLSPYAHYCNEVLFGIMGKENAKAWLKENPMGFDTSSDGPLINEIFDELFFGENGWDEFDRETIVKKYYGYLSDFNKLLERIVCVDKKYYKYIYSFIERQTALASKIYSEKKSEEELTGNETTEQVYRYSKEIRKLVQIAACCIRGNISKTMTGTLAEVAGLMKIYNYDFDKIFACMYPETIEDEEECQEA